MMNCLLNCRGLHASTSCFCGRSRLSEMVTRVGVDTFWGLAEKKDNSGNVIVSKEAKSQTKLATVQKTDCGQRSHSQRRFKLTRTDFSLVRSSGSSVLSYLTDS
jgi:hypothetical protein